MGGLTLSDIERWDPMAVQQVFGEAMRRATGTRDSAARVYNLTAFADWDGDAARAARESANRIRVDLNAHADACEAVGNAARAAVGEIQSVKDRLRQIKSELQFGITIDEATAEVRPPPDVASRPNARVIQLKVDELQRRLNQVMADAQKADEDLAAAIRAADGSLTPEQVTDQLDGGPVVMPFPPSSGDPQDVKKWWDSMTPQQQGRAIASFGDKLGNVDGIPSAVRSEINVARLPQEIARLEQIASQRAFLPNGLPDPKLAEQVRIANDKLADLYALRDTLAKHPEAGLLLLDTTSNPGRVLAATFVGDVDNAKNVSVTTPGMNTRVSSSIDGMTGEAIALRNQALALSHGESVASIAWIGYETPGLNYDVTNDALAKAGATPLNRLYHGLAATTNVPDQHLTALGHSYGSLTTSLALKQGAPVDDVVLYGSPGAEITDASQLGVAPGHAYFEVAQRDAVAIDIADLGAYDGQLQDVPGMTPLWTGPGATHDPSGPCVVLDGAAGHSEYPRLGTDGIHLRTSGYNMAAIVANNPDALITGDPIPQTKPYGIFPWMDTYNPDYHS